MIFNFFSIINRAILKHLLELFKPICLPTECHMMNQFPNGCLSKQGVHKLIVAEQSKSLFMTSWVTWFISRHPMSGCARVTNIISSPPEGQTHSKHPAVCRSVCHRHKLCWQILNSASSTFSVWGFECFVSGHHWLGAFYDAFTTLYTPLLACVQATFYP